MSNVRLVTWNINSVRLRMPIVEQLVDEFSPDIISFQETKVQDDAFPRKKFEKLGYEYIYPFGQKGYHGVATVSRIPLDGHEKHHWAGKDDTRHQSLILPGGVELHNFYVPAGGDVPDPDENEKFAHKLQFLDEVTEWFASRRDDGNKMILVGDLNIAPAEADVWSHKQLLKVVSHTPVEVERMAKWYKSHDFIDAVRQFIPEDEKIFSWWSYRSKDYRVNNRGRRLDHVWATPAIMDAVKSINIHTDARGWVKPSDHVPIIFDMDLPA